MTWIDIEAVRCLVLQSGWTEVQFNYTSRVIGVNGVNVYYTTGTVGTCTNHPRQGETQFLRRSVSLEGLESLFQNVPARAAEDGPEPSLESQNWYGYFPGRKEMSKFDCDMVTFVALSETSYFLVTLSSEC